MELFDNLPDERKRAILLQTQEGLLFELVPLIVRNGIDPSDFDELNPTATVEELANTIDAARIYQICESLEIIRTKLS
jgi:hypothetical protein